MPKVRISPKKLSSFLKVDCFGEIQKIQFAGDKLPRDIVSRPDFFKHLFVEVKNGKLPVRFGTEDHYREYKYDQWICDIKNAIDSSVVFIEGYAGCGKSVFVQKVLTEIFPDMDYDRNYYNYDIGFSFEESHQERIKDAILECFIDQYIQFIAIGRKDIIEKMEELLEQNEIICLDNARNIFYDFVGSKAYSSAKKLLLESSDIKNFKKIIHDQLTKLHSEQIIYIDCILRLSKYIVCENEPETQIICYDNLDAIENNVELCNFDDILLTVKENMNTYLDKSECNYKLRGRPHFVFLATFRKITAVRVGLFDGSERFGDNRRQQENVYFISAAHLFDYQKMVENRYKFLKKYVKDHTLDFEMKPILKQMREIVQLFNTDFVKSRFAGLWNNNYRTCSDIMECVMDRYEKEVLSCITLTKQHFDSYDDRINVAGGASAIFLSIICKVQRDCDYWGKLHLSVSELNGSTPSVVEIEQSPVLVHRLTTLSRLILTYIRNNAFIEHSNVSTIDIYNVFLGIYSVDDIARVISNMLTHDRKGYWRRPIVYTKNVIPEGQDVFEELRNQGELFRKGINPEEYQFTEITTCDCGESFVTRVSCDYEYYSARLGHSKSLYLIDDYQEIFEILKNVYNAVVSCCQKMIVFRELYCIKKPDICKTYTDQMFHPRTYSGKTQLHTERIIFNHIEYLDNYRYYITHFSAAFNSTEKEKINDEVLGRIGQYLKLYYDSITSIDSRRIEIANDLSGKLKRVKDNPNNSAIRIKSSKS